MGINKRLLVAVGVAFALVAAPACASKPSTHAATEKGVEAAPAASLAPATAVTPTAETHRSRRTGAATVTAAASARDKPEHGSSIRTITVSAPYTDPEASAFDGFQCAGLASTPSCGVRFVGTSTWSGGTITGNEHYALTGGPTTDGKLTYDGPAYITGTVQGCGTGTFIIDNYGGYIDFTQDDPTDNFEGGVGGSAPGFNYWKIREGSGAGGLAGLVSGGGVNHWRFYNTGGAGLGGPEGIGLFTGAITCRPMVSAASTR